MRWLRVLVVVGALIGSLVPTMASAQEPETPRSEAVIEGRWKFTFTRQAVSEQWFDAPSWAVDQARADSPPLNAVGSKESRTYDFSMSCEGDACTLTLAPDCSWARSGKRWSGMLPSRDLGGCHQSGYDRTISSFTSMSVRVTKAIETSDGLVATNLDGEGTFADWVWHWWMDEGSTRNVTYAQTAEVTAVAKRLDPPKALPTTTTTSSTTSTTMAPPPSQPTTTVPGLAPEQVVTGEEAAEARVEGSWQIDGSVVAVEGEDPGIWSVGKPFSSVWELDPTCTDGPCDVSLGDCQLARSGGTYVDTDLCSVEIGACDSPPPGTAPIQFDVVEAVETVEGLQASRIAGTAGDVPFHICGKKWTTITMEYTGVRTDLPAVPTPTSTTEVTTTTVPATTSTTVAAVAVPPAGGGGGGPVAPSGGGGGPVAPAGVPSLAASLRGPDAVSWALPVVATNALLALLLVLLMPFPGELFNRTLDEHYDEVTGWFRRLVPGGRSERSSERRSRVRGSWLTLGLVLVAGTLLAGLLDPGFGWNRSTGALLVGAGLGLLGVMAVGLGVSAWFVRRRDTGVSLSVRALPGALVVAAACVLLSRVVGFEPGYLYGVLAGLVVGGALSAVDEGKQAALASGVTALVALAAWLGWTWLQPSLGSDPSFGLTVVDTALATLFVAGLEGLVFGLVPMRFLAGAQVLKWSKLVWGLLFGAGVFAFLQLLAHPGAGYGPTESAVPFLTAAALFAGFGLVSVGFWGWFRIRDRRQPALEEPELT